MMAYTPSAHQHAVVQSTAGDWKARNKIRRLWNKYTSLWARKDEGQWMR